MRAVVVKGFTGADFKIYRIQEMGKPCSIGRAGIGNAMLNVALFFNTSFTIMWNVLGSLSVQLILK